MSKSYTFSINTTFSFEMQEIDSASFLNAKDLSFLSLLCAPLTVKSPVTTISASL